MIKQIGVTVILLLVVVSLTVGSVSSSVIQSSDNRNSIISGRMFGGIAASSFGLGASPFTAAGLPFAFAAQLPFNNNAPAILSQESNGQRFTSVVVDLSGQGAVH